MPRDNVLFAAWTDLPTAPKTTAVPHPALPNPKRVWLAIMLNDPWIFAIQNKLIITNIIPSKAALPEPNLSENAPNKGDPIPIIKTLRAAAKEKRRAVLEIIE